MSESVVSSKSEDISALALALNQAQMNLPTVQKDSTNPFFDSRYASLKAVVLESLPILTAEGLAIAQFPSFHGLKTYLLHTSGQWIAEEMRLHVGTTPQTHGSAITYARRYAWCSILGIVVDEDDDGNAAAQAPAQQPRPAVSNQTATTQPPAQNQQRSNNDTPPQPSPGCNIKLGGKNPITDGQKRALWAISEGGEKFSLSGFIGMHTNGKTEDSLTSWEASQLIDGVNKGTLATTTPTAGAEAVAAAFPGAEIVKPAEAGYGFDEEPF